MKTEGISLLNVNMNSQISSKTGKTAEKGFDNIMNIKSQSDKKTDKTGDSVKENKDLDNSSGKIEKKGLEKVANTNSKVVKKVENNSKKIDETDFEEIEKEVGNLFEDTFGLKLEELVDIAQRLGINLKDLIGQVQENQGEISIVNIEVLQSFVMEFHGIEDKAAFITNDKIIDELNSLKDGLENIVSEFTGIDLKKITELDQNNLNDFSSMLNQFLDSQEEVLETTDITNLDTQAEVSEDADVDIPVIIEEKFDKEENFEGDLSNQNENTEKKDDTSQIGESNQRQEHTNVHENVSNAELFANRLVQTSAGEEVSVTQVQTMRNIVVQVVTQIRVRLMPETTNMDIMLHPASLGRVNLHVSMTGSVSTATLTVENQVAKEALESQMIILKERFEEQGLKVDAVEVNVSEFGLRENEERNQNQNHEGSSSQRNRSSKSVIMEDNLEESDENRETNASRVDINSTVDYTA